MKKFATLITGPAYHPPNIMCSIMWCTNLNINTDNIIKWWYVTCHITIMHHDHEHWYVTYFGLFTKSCDRSYDLVNRKWWCTEYTVILIPMLVPTCYPTLPLPKNDFALLFKRYCTQSKCKTIISEGCPFISCEKCWNSSRISMQKKQKQEKPNEGSCTPAIALRNGHLDEESCTELKDMSRMTSVFKRTLPNKHFRQTLLSSLRMKMQWWHT